MKTEIQECIKFLIPPPGARGEGALTNFARKSRLNKWGWSTREVVGTLTALLENAKQNPILF